MNYLKEKYMNDVKIYNFVNKLLGLVKAKFLTLKDIEDSVKILKIKLGESRKNNNKSSNNFSLADAHIRDYLGLNKED